MDIGSFFQSATTRSTLPLQVVASRIYQLLESQLTNSAIEFEEMRQITENMKDKPWISEDRLLKLEKAMERKSKRKETPVAVEKPKDASYEEDEDEVVPEPPKRRVKLERKKASCVRFFGHWLWETGGRRRTANKTSLFQTDN